METTLLRYLLHSWEHESRHHFVWYSRLCRPPLLVLFPPSYSLRESIYLTTEIRPLWVLLLPASLTLVPVPMISEVTREASRVIVGILQDRDVWPGPRARCRCSWLIVLMGSNYICRDTMAQRMGEMFPLSPGLRYVIMPFLFHLSWFVFLCSRALIISWK